MWKLTEASIWTTKIYKIPMNPQFSGVRSTAHLYITNIYIIKIPSPQHISIPFTSVPVEMLLINIRWFIGSILVLQVGGWMKLQPLALGVRVKFFIVSNKFGTAYRG